MFDPKILQPYQSERGMVLRNVLFNHHVCESIRTGGSLNRKRLISLYESGEHDIPALSPKSVALKTNWRVVKKGQVLKLGVWNDADGVDLSTGKPRYGIRVPESTWSARYQQWGSWRA